MNDQLGENILNFSKNEIVLKPFIRNLGVCVASSLRRQLKKLNETVFYILKQSCIFGSIDKNFGIETLHSFIIYEYCR